MTTQKRKIAQDAGRIESMMLRYQRQVGEVTARHTIHDIEYRTGLKIDAAKKAVEYMIDLEMIAADICHGTLFYYLKGITK